MRNALSLFTAFCLGTALVGCHSSSVAPTPTPDKSPTNKEEPQVNNPGWTLKLQSKCQNNPEENCLGAYGFSVLADGRFIVGPGPGGELRNGSITPEEQSALSAALVTTLAGPHVETTGHETIEAAESNDVLTLIRGTNSAEELVKTEGTELNFHTPSAEDAKSLLLAVRTLAAKYYNPLPFPDACGDGAITVQTLFNSMQTCATDSDCIYIDSSTFEPIEMSSTPSVVSDDCTLIRPLIVGNASLIRMNKTKLEESLSQVVQACGETIKRSECETKELKLSGVPACVQGSCQAPNH